MYWKMIENLIFLLEVVYCSSFFSNCSFLNFFKILFCSSRTFLCCFLFQKFLLKFFVARLSDRIPVFQTCLFFQIFSLFFSGKRFFNSFQHFFCFYFFTNRRFLISFAPTKPTFLETSFVLPESFIVALQDSSFFKPIFSCFCFTKSFPKFILFFTFFF